MGVRCHMFQPVPAAEHLVLPAVNGLTVALDQIALESCEEESSHPSTSKCLALGQLPVVD